MANENKLKHLEFIQSVITRHNSNSFMLKGWAITITAALFALAGSQGNPLIGIIAMLPIFLFKKIDSFYLSNERKFRDLYSAAVRGWAYLPNKSMTKDEFEEKYPEFTKKLKDDNRVDAKDIPKDVLEHEIKLFDMNVNPFKCWVDNSVDNVKESTTIKNFYNSFCYISIGITLLLGIQWGIGIYSNPSNQEHSLKIEPFQVQSVKDSTVLNTISVYDTVVTTVYDTVVIDVVPTNDKADSNQTQ